MENMRFFVDPHDTATDTFPAGIDPAPVKTGPL